MHVGMVHQVLTPCVENAEKANLCAEMFWIGADLQESGGAGSKQECVEQLFIVQHQVSERVGNREDQMHVGNV